MAQDGSEEESDMESEREIVAKQDTQVTAEEKLDEIDLGTNPQNSRPISISSKFLKEGKVQLILLLKDFKDIFEWDYSETSGLDPG